MLIATWNVNSLRVRLPPLLEWLKQHHPDVVAIQETKVEDKDFPLQALQEAGYHVVFSGQKTYNGVALLSKFPIQEAVTDLPGITDPQRRILMASTQGLQIINLYVPNGESIDSAKYQYKLSWLEQVAAFLKTQGNTVSKSIVLGDFNIAPEARDVHDPAAWEGQVLVSDLERSALQSIFSLGFKDSFRLFEQPEKSYTWWDYRGGAFRRNHGLRIDLILLSTALVPYCKECRIDKAPRGGERPSDHVPVLISLDYTP